MDPKLTRHEYGIDLLRILSMFMVVILHTLGNGGVLDHVRSGTANYYAAWFLEIAALCAVNCYALISGYVLYNSSFKLSRIIQLWLQVSFYSVIITVLFFFFDRGSVGKKEILLSMAPVLTARYWYVTAYVGLFFFTPFINKAMDSFDKKTSQKLVITTIFLLSVLPMLTVYDLFITNVGYSMVWLIALYLIGSYIKKYDALASLKKRTLLLYAACVTAVLLIKVVVEVLPTGLSSLSKFSWNFAQYTSPFILFAAIFLFLFFSRLQVNSKIAIRLISFFSPISFGVYIIQVHRLMWGRVFMNRFIFLSSSPTILLVLGTLAFAVAVYITLALTDFVRQLIFKLIQIPKLSEYIGVNVSKRFDRLFSEDIQSLV